jgi:hypothetical protein
VQLAAQLIEAPLEIGEVHRQPLFESEETIKPGGRLLKHAARRAKQPTGLLATLPAQGEGIHVFNPSEQPFPHPRA